MSEQQKPFAFQNCGHISFKILVQQRPHLSLNLCRALNVTQILLVHASSMYLDGDLSLLFFFLSRELLFANPHRSLERHTKWKSETGKEWWNKRQSSSNSKNTPQPHTTTTQGKTTTKTHTTQKQQPGLAQKMAKNKTLTRHNVAAKWMKSLQR